MHNSPPRRPHPCQGGTCQSGRATARPADLRVQRLGMGWDVPSRGGARVTELRGGPLGSEGPPRTPPGAGLGAERASRGRRPRGSRRRRRGRARGAGRPICKRGLGPARPGRLRCEGPGAGPLLAPSPPGGKGVPGAPRRGWARWPGVPTPDPRELSAGSWSARGGLGLGWAGLPKGHGTDV